MKYTFKRGSRAQNIIVEKVTKFILDNLANNIRFFTETGKEVFPLEELKKDKHPHQSIHFIIVDFYEYPYVDSLRNTVLQFYMGFHAPVCDPAAIWIAENKTIEFTADGFTIHRLEVEGMVYESLTAKVMNRSAVPGPAGVDMNQKPA